MKSWELTTPQSHTRQETSASPLQSYTDDDALPASRYTSPQPPAAKAQWKTPHNPPATQTRALRENSPESTWTKTPSKSELPWLRRSYEAKKSKHADDPQSHPPPKPAFRAP